MHIVFEFGQNLLAANQHQADHNRQWFDQQSICCLNVMSSPGAGKTSLLEKVLPLLTPFYRLAVLEGDMTTQLDADRLRQSGIPVIAITTGRACHLDARMIHGGLHQLEQESGSLDDFDLVIVENVGNLVCPAEFEVGEHAKVAVLSVTEGEDKPLKYPLMFQQADCLLINKVDLLPFLDIDRQKLENNVHEINPDVPIFWVSARTGEGIHQWLNWIHAKIMTEN